MNPLAPEPSPLEPFRKLHLAAFFAELRGVLESRQMSWRQSPGLVADETLLRDLRHQSFEKRHDETFTTLRAKPKRVNFCPVVKRLVRRRFPHWEFLANDGDRIVFENLVAMRLDLHLIFQLHEWAWQRKGFSLQLEVQLGSDAACPEVKLLQPLSAFFGVGGAPLWPFASLEQLEAALQAAGDLLDQVLPAFEDLALQRLFPLPMTPPPVVETRDISTAWTAWGHIQRQVVKWAPGAQLVFVHGPLQSDPPTRDRPRPALPERWDFTTEDPATGRRLSVTVPRHGPITSLESPRPENPWERPLAHQLIDSNTAFQLANQALGPVAGEAVQVGFGLMWAPPPRSAFANPFWGLNYLIQAAPPLNSRLVRIDALQGRVLEVK